MSKEMTEEEVQQRFIDAVWKWVDYWNHLKEETPERRVKGVAFTILGLIDGVDELPHMILAPEPHPTDKKDAVENDEDWFPENTENIKGDISGDLHNQFYKDRT